VALRRRLSPGLPLSHTSKEASDLAVQYFQAFTDNGEAIIPYSWATIVQMNCHPARRLALNSARWRSRSVACRLVASTVPRSNSAT